MLQPGDLVVDIGANIGFFTLLAAQCVGASGRVLAFEPMPETNADLREILTLIGSRTSSCMTTLRPIAMATFYPGPVDHCGTSSLRPVEGGRKAICVRTARFDGLLPQGQRVALVKIDVEGAEYHAIEGMIGQIERDHPDLVVEVTDRYLQPLGHSAQDLCHRLCDLGYRAYSIEHEELCLLNIKKSNFSGQFNAVVSGRG
ncbi:FkbM family methyltransferase [Tautonia rosea]|uniref:FkbM family methyltransferase n=1 Tax=Tautonia rosea TaxID=2728037 RepID=UPI0028F40506|nr:FkbM family methyltransferase [Tautonia rosea]